MNRIKLGGISFSLLLVFQSVVAIAQNPQLREAQVACAIMREIPRSDAYKKLEYVEQVRLTASQAPYIGDVATINEAIRLGLCEELVLNHPGWVEAIEDAQEDERRARELAQLREEEAEARRVERLAAEYEARKKAREKEEEARRKEREQQIALIEELAGRQRGECDGESVMLISCMMAAQISQNWRRPPLARNGMEVLLYISLVPTGEVVSVSVSSSSGSTDFDRSAINAVERVGRFPEVAALSIQDFERYFRRFPLRFKPEDLRY